MAEPRSILENNQNTYDRRLIFTSKTCKNSLNQAFRLTTPVDNRRPYMPLTFQRQ